MVIAGFQKMTLLDYPGKLAALVFTQGCNFACSYCHNPEMIPRTMKRIIPGSESLRPQDLFNFLKRRSGLLDGVVITGGEPTLQEDLEGFIREIKSLGYLIKLDTNGSRPEVLERLLKAYLLDYIAMDLKQTSEKYAELTRNDCVSKILNSIKLIMQSGVDYEFRSTLVPGIHCETDIAAMGHLIKGAKLWFLQNFCSFKTLDRQLLQNRSFSDQEMSRFQDIAQCSVTEVRVRNSVGVLPA